MIHGHQSIIEVAHNGIAKGAVVAKEDKKTRMANQLPHKRTIKKAIPQTPCNSTAYFS